MTKTAEELILEHYGVPGQKWGVRKARKTSSDFKKTVPLRKRKSSELSNKQLKTVNERIGLEQNFHRLNPSTMSKGKAAAAGMLATATMAATAYNLYNSPAGKAAISSGKKFMKKKV